MKRDIKNIVRYLDDRENSDIIFKKSKLFKMFKDDPDLLEVLGQLDPRPLNKYADPNHPTDAELKRRREINEYNERIQHDQIIPFLKLNGTQTEVVNYVCFDIREQENYRYNDKMKHQELWVMVMVYENDINSEYTTEDGMRIPRTDLVEYIIKDLLAWSNVFGATLVPQASIPDIVDMKYYCRTIKFTMAAPNTVHTSGGNKYDRFN